MFRKCDKSLHASYQTKFSFGRSNSVSACVRFPRDSRGVVLVLAAQTAGLPSPAVCRITLCNVSKPPGRGLVPGPGINCTGPREVLLEFVTLVF